MASVRHACSLCIWIIVGISFGLILFDSWREHQETVRSQVSSVSLVEPRVFKFHENVKTKIYKKECPNYLIQSGKSVFNISTITDLKRVVKSQDIRSQLCYRYSAFKSYDFWNMSEYDSLYALSQCKIIKKTACNFSRDNHKSTVTRFHDLLYERGSLVRFDLERRIAYSAF